MIPTLQIGDLILVNKYQYGIRLPVVNGRIVDLDTRSGATSSCSGIRISPTQDYIKRVVGLPGDRVDYHDRRLTINGGSGADAGSGAVFRPLPACRHTSNTWRLSAASSTGSSTTKAKVHLSIPHCSIRIPKRASTVAVGVACTVPPESYFVMGDNRDNSEDSRFWGFVPDRNLVGRAFFIWMNFGNVGRIGSIH